MLGEDRLSEYDRSRLIENNKKISNLLETNEEILKNAGFNIPRDNFAFDPDKEAHLRIQIPKGYIRTKNYYMSEYGLYRICNGDEAKASNIAYSLELSDFYNYILNRMGIYGPILAMMYKQATINIISIIEVFVKTYAETLRQKCMECPKRNDCRRMLSKKKHIKMHFNDLIDVYKQECLIDGISDGAYTRICELYVYRNSIHLSKSKDNELKEDMHSRKLYNEAIMYMKSINDAMVIELEEYSDTGLCRRYTPKRH